jgi:hypothetical protein
MDRRVSAKGTKHRASAFRGAFQASDCSLDRLDVLPMLRSSPRQCAELTARLYSSHARLPDLAKHLFLACKNLQREIEVLKIIPHP